MKIRAFIDKFLTLICLFIPFYLISNFISQNVAIKILLATLFSVLGITAISLIQKYNKSKVNYKNFELYATVHGASYIYEMLLQVFDNIDFVSKGDYLISSDKTMIVCSVKFGGISPDEILKYSKMAQKEEATKCYLIAKDLPKNAAMTLFNFADNLKFIPLKIVFKLLKSHKLLPQKLSVKIGKLDYSNNIFDIIFDSNNIKKFLFVAVILFAFSFLIPLKIYYIVLGSINILFAIICLIRGKSGKYNGKYEIFEKKNNFKQNAK